MDRFLSKMSALSFYEIGEITRNEERFSEISVHVSFNPIKGVFSV